MSLTRTQIASRIASATRLLDRHDVQARTDLARTARTYLIRKLYYGERVLLLMRDGRDWSKELDLLLFNSKAAARAVSDLTSEKQQ